MLFRSIEESAYATARRQEAGEELVVGVNAFADDEESDIPIMEIDPRIAEEQARRLGEMKASRAAGVVRERLAEVRRAAGSDTNLLVPIREALRAEATIGEVCDELRAEKIMQGYLFEKEKEGKIEILWDHVVDEGTVPDVAPDERVPGIAIERVDRGRHPWLAGAALPWNRPAGLRVGSDRFHSGL